MTVPYSSFIVVSSYFIFSYFDGLSFFKWLNICRSTCELVDIPAHRGVYVNVILGTGSLQRLKKGEVI